LDLLTDRLFDAVGRVHLPSPRVDEQESSSSPFGIELASVARHPGLFFDHGHSLSDDAVDQSRLPDVGPPDDCHDRQAVIRRGGGHTYTDQGAIRARAWVAVHSRSLSSHPFSLGGRAVTPASTRLDSVVTKLRSWGGRGKYSVSSVVRQSSKPWTGSTRSITSWTRWSGADAPAVMPTTSAPASHSAWIRSAESIR